MQMKMAAAQGRLPIPLVDDFLYVFGNTGPTPGGAIAIAFGDMIVPDAPELSKKISEEVTDKIDWAFDQRW